MFSQLPSRAESPPDSQEIYPMTSVIVSPASTDGDYLSGLCPEQLRVTKEMMRGNGGSEGGSLRGITVLKEVHVQRQDRSEFEWD